MSKRAIFGPNASQQNSAYSITPSASNCIELGMFDLLRYRRRDNAALLCVFDFETKPSGAARTGHYRMSGSAPQLNR